MVKIGAGGEETQFYTPKSGCLYVCMYVWMDGWMDVCYTARVAVECAMLHGMALCSASREMVRKCTVGRENEEE